MKYILSIIILFIIGCNTAPEKHESEVFLGEPEIIWSFGFDNHWWGGTYAPPTLLGDSLVLFSGGSGINCLTVDSGSLNWDNSYLSTGYLHQKFDHDDSNLFGYGGEGSVYSIKLKDGTESWVSTINSVRTYSFTADVDEEFLYFGTSGYYDKRYVWKSNKIDGTLIDSVFCNYMPWHVDKQESGLHVSFGWSPDGNADFVGQIITFDPSAMDTLWVHDEPGGGFNVCAPTFADGIMYVGTVWGADDKVIALNAQTGSVIWENNSDNISAVKVLLVGEILYVETGASVRALNKLTGNQIWRSNFSNPDESPTLSYWDGYIYIENYGTLHILDGTTGESIHSMHGPDNASIEQVSTGAGKIFVQSTQHLYAFSPYGPEKNSE